LLLEADLMDSALNIESVVKAYSDKTVVDRLSMQVASGEIFGLVGPNGSGKTTTIRMGLDIIKPDSGTVALFGSAPDRSNLSRVGYLPEERGLYQRSKVIEMLSYLGRLKRLDSKTATSRADDLLERVGLSEHRDKRVSALSRGMSQLVQFAGALIHEPDLIILDEPFSGLDPLNVQLMKRMINEQRDRGAAIVFSTHQMTDVEEMCERVLLIADGTVLLYGNLAEIKRAHGKNSVRVVADSKPGILVGAEGDDIGDRIVEYKIGAESRPEEVLRAYLDAGIHVDRYEVVLPSLTDIFIEEVGRAREIE
jgi:ABC-2 type transport system ATP-binding protein